MNKRILLIGSFVLMCLAQLYIPIKMILDKEKVLKEGVVYKFETAPIDPTDPFKGKYISLQFTENKIALNADIEWERKEKVFVSLEKDENGFAKIASVSKTKPMDGMDFVEANVSYVSGGTNKELIIQYPFDRYYMEEFKALPAEKAYREVQRNGGKKAYALVSVKEGNSVLKDVVIDDKPIKDLIEEQLNDLGK